MGWFDQFLDVQQPGLPPSEPPPDDSPDWFWDGSAWTRRETVNPQNPSQPPPTAIPRVPPPTTTPPTPPPAALPPVLAGWDAGKWADPNKQSDKYKVGRILAKYPPTVEGLQQAIPELQAAYPGLSFNGKDTITVPGLGDIDVLQGASGGGVAWQWLDKAADARERAAMGQPGLPGTTGDDLSYGGGGSGGGVPGGTGGGGTAGSWAMPAGSTYQFGGVPGYTGGSAFSVPGGAYGASGTGQIPGHTASTAPAGTASGAVNPVTSTGSAATTSYNRAPSFTPLDPFQAPDAPDAAAPWSGTAFDVGPGSEKFVLPTGQAALDQDPGYQFRLQQGKDALEQSAAYKGLLRTGGAVKDIQDYGQRAASQEYQNAVDRAMAVAGFNTSNRQKDTALGLQANQQNNAFSLEGAKWNADQTDRAYQNRYTGANQQYAYANQQNLAGNAQAMTGYQTDVGRELGHKGLDITAEQNRALNAMNGQQQQWMQIYMQNGQSFDQAYKLMLARLQYPA